MTVTKNTIIAEILNNDPTQGCVPIFLSTGMHCLGCPRFLRRDHCRGL